MLKVLVTGSSGFIGKHLVEALRLRGDTAVIEFNRGSMPMELQRALEEVDVIFHLAGINRTLTPGEFQTGNVDFTQSLCAALSDLGRKPMLVFSSSVQAALDNPYGRSKSDAEVAVTRWAQQVHARAIIFRLKNVFGKWCRPNYNSVTATFCYNIAHDLPIAISDPTRVLELVYIDDVVASFIGCLDNMTSPKTEFREINISYKISLGELADRLRTFRDSRRTLVLPSFETEFARRLYATYLSYVEASEFTYGLEIKVDERGSLAEFMKSTQLGQIFISRTKPGVTRGNHYHHTKVEKFFVVEGCAVVRLRQIGSDKVIEKRVDGRDFKVVDIPPGYTHSIENVGLEELITLFWASEIFDIKKPDVTMMPVVV